MVVIDRIKDGLSLRIAGKAGRPQFMGLSWFGRSHFGYYYKYAGYYNLRRKKGGNIISKTVFYYPPQANTAPQIARQNVFRDGVSAWHALDDNTKKIYNQRKYKRGRSGFNRFMTEYLKNN